MSSRLERLFILLESGGSSVTRRAAAKQLGDVVKGQQPLLDVKPLLLRLLPLLFSKNWDTRVAGAAALAAVLDNIPVWSPKPLYQHEDASTDVDEGCKTEAAIAAVQSVLNSGSPLGADNGYSLEEDTIQGDSSSRLQRERQLLNERLGLDLAEKIGLDISDLISIDDLKQTHSNENQQASGKRNVGELLSGVEDGDCQPPAAEQDGCSGLKRRRLSSQDSIDQRDVSRTDAADAAQPVLSDASKKVVEEEVWPLLWLSKSLLCRLFSGCWETRHGAATAIRELLGSHGAAGGKKDNLTLHQLARHHQQWVWGVCLRLVCVLALDTFGDYVSDQVVAPVRETVAQALGVACLHLSSEHVSGVVELLKQLLMWQGGWTARHGGLLGLKYTLAARPDIRRDLLHTAYIHIYSGLLDETDDVVGVAAECLSVCCSSPSPRLKRESAGADSSVPGAKSQQQHDASSEDDDGNDSCMVIDLEPESKRSNAGGESCISLMEWLADAELQELLSRVWRLLLHVDDLSASTPSLLMLLASLMKCPHIYSRLVAGSLTELVPRLYPFLYHASSSVRRSALTTLATITDVPAAGNAPHSVIDATSQTEAPSNNTIGPAADNVTTDREIASEDPGCSSTVTSSSRLKSSSPSSVGCQNANVQNDDSSNLNESTAATAAGITKDSDTYTISSNDGEATSVESVADAYSASLVVFRSWCEAILPTLLRHLFQRSLLETNISHLALIEQIWVQLLQYCSLNAVLVCTCPLVASWLGLVATPASVQLEQSLLLLLPSTRPTQCSIQSEGLTAGAVEQPVYYVGGSQHCTNSELVTNKIMATKLLGELSVYLSQPMEGVVYESNQQPIQCYTRLLLAQLNSRSASQRTTAAAVTRRWALAYTAAHTATPQHLTESEQQTNKTTSQHEKLGDQSCDSPQQQIRPNSSSSGSYTAGASIAEQQAVKLQNLATSQYLANHTLKQSSDDRSNATALANIAMQELHTALLNCLTQPVYYDEIAVSFTRLQQDTKDFLSMVKHYNLEVDNSFMTATVLTLDQMSEVVQGKWLLQQLGNSKLRPKVRCMLEKRRSALLHSLQATTLTHDKLTLSTRSEAAGALVRLGVLPAKLNPVVKPLIDAIKLQENKQLQSEAGKDLSLLLELCAVRDKSPNAKIVKNLAAFSCVDARHTPQIMRNMNGATESDGGKYSGIYFLKAMSEDVEEQHSAQLESGVVKRAEDDDSVVVKRKRGRPPNKQCQQQPSNSLPRPQVDERKLSVQRCGCSLALQHLVRHFEENLPSALPALWESIMKPLENNTHSTNIAQPITNKYGNKSESSSEPGIRNGACNANEPSSKDADNAIALASSAFSVANLLAPEEQKKAQCDNTQGLSDSSDSKSIDSKATKEDNDKLNCSGIVLTTEDSDAKAQETINWLQQLETVVPALHATLIKKFCSQLPSLCHYLQHRYCAVRHMAARVLAVLVTVNTDSVIVFLLRYLLPCLDDHSNVTRRQGALECLHLIVEKMALKILPYVVMLIVPLLGGSGDSDPSVRSASSQVFASVIRLLPLDGYIPDPPNLPLVITEQREQNRKFLYQLMDGRKAHQFDIPIKMNASLREYQQSGVNWLAFLRDYGVHGILCDDMGLGKTLQTLCILASTHYEHLQRQALKTERTGEVLQSLVICPPTLTGHWIHEVQTFVPPGLLQPLLYCGPPLERQKLRQVFAQHNLIVASYDIVRNDADFFASFQWLYIVLDEGHVIKNTKTKSYQAMKRLSGRHRLILSGTPIQNNVLDLWSLFDFLMPGYLGTERQFNIKFSRPILASRDGKASRSEQEAGVVAMEALHRQTLPFMMRRLKEHVLKELPPKITQDYYCELSPLQKFLYQHFLQAQGTDLENDQTPKTHIFQALQYLRLLCNHPALVLRPQHPRYTALLRAAAISPCDLHNIALAAKLPALKELLQECGIGVGGSSGGEETSLVAPHRVLIFCQLKNMLDIIQNDLLKVHLPGVTYLRLDGSVPASKRYGLVQRFNEDPSIDLMLLTTHVGGLGLNLTGADTVIFVEHDWNPMKDLQAMDRVHRIGQKRVVNVYRLITRNTIEEKIMGLQKFKLQTANTVINPDNANMGSMATDQMLDLFSLSNSTSEKPAPGKRNEGRIQACNAPLAVLDNLPDLWDQQQYHDEYDLDKFIANINVRS